MKRSGLILGMLILLSGCGDVRRGGVVLTFDDNQVDSWVEAHKNLDFVGTFYVTFFQDYQAEKYLLLQEAGHEIGHHTATHPNAKQYIEDNGAQDYLDYEIVEHKEDLESFGLDIVSFAYPYGVAALSKNLLQIFQSIRLTAYGMITENSPIFVDPLKPKRVLHGAGIDVSYNRSDEDIKNAIRIAAEKGQYVVFYGHSIRPDADIQPGQQSTPYSRIQMIVDEAEKVGLPLVRVRDMYKNVNASN